MNIRLLITLVISKITIKACRILRRGGTSLPGKVARKLYPSVLSELTKNFKIIMVTGTNGKTTTTRIIGQILKENGIDYITNKSGANLVSGIITTFIASSNLKGRFVTSTALLEIDEAAFQAISESLEPDILVVTNFFRDQLDRYGELYSTLNGVRAGIQRSKKTRLILNADDSLCASLGRNTENRVTYYGFAGDAYQTAETAVNSDAGFCVYCKTRYSYTNVVYGHLGGFECPNCSYRHPETDITCVKVKELTSSSSSITFSVKAAEAVLEGCACGTGGNPSTEGGSTETSPEVCSSNFEAVVSLPGLYNIYNAIAAVSLGHVLGFPVENSIKALSSFECGFGRMETIPVDGKTIKVILVKNPTGFNQVLSYLHTEEKKIQLAFLINDNLADGTDISWLWDVDFECLTAMDAKLVNIYTSGTRAEDMAVRLKYAGIYTDKIRIVKDYRELLSVGLSKTEEGGSFYVLPTYTAMLDFRKVLKNRFRLREFWK